MRGRKSSLVVLLSTDQKDQLEYWTRCSTMPAGVVRRARAILLLAQHRCFEQVRRLTGMRVTHLRKWAGRFLKDGPEGLQDRPRPGRTPVFSPRRGDASGEDGLRTAGSGRPVAVAVGL